MCTSYGDFFSLFLCNSTSLSQALWCKLKACSRHIVPFHVVPLSYAAQNNSGLQKTSCSRFLLQSIFFTWSMSSPRETSSDRVMKVLCEQLNLIAFVEGQEGYEQCMTRVFNESPFKRPKAFIKPRTADEVCHVLQHASANHLQVSVLGGGHDPKGKLRNGVRIFPPSTTCAGKCNQSSWSCIHLANQMPTRLNL